MADSQALSTYSKDTPLAKFNNVIFSPKMQTHLINTLQKQYKEKFEKNVIALVSNNSNLQQCEPTSIIFACLKGAALNLSLDQTLGLAYVIPYSGQAQFQIGWRGLMQLALRSGQVINLNVTDVREGELVNENQLTGEVHFDFVQNQNAREALKIIGYAGFLELRSGFRKITYWPIEALTKHKIFYYDRSKAG